MPHHHKTPFVPQTREQIKAEFAARGITLTQWSAEHGFDRRSVYAVLNGFSAATHGNAHRIAIALGMKAPPESFSPQQQRRAGG